MRVRSEDSGDAPVEVQSERAFFGGRLGVEVDQDAPIVYRSQKVVRDAERAIQGRKKDPPLEIDDHEGFPVLFELHDALAGTDPGVVRRTDHARGFRKMGHELGLVPNMVSGRDAVHSERKQLLKYFLREAASCSGVLTVCNQEILLAMPLPENREPFGEALPPGAPHNVADKENPHRRSAISRIPSPVFPC